MEEKIYKEDKYQVIYNTDFRKIPLHSFFPVERNIIMTICSKLKRQETNIVEFSFDEFKKIINWKKKNEKLFVENLKNTNEKLMSLKNTVKIGSRTIQFVLFPLFEVDEKNKILRVRVLKEFSYLLNDFSKFTSLDLEIYSSLSSNYSKSLFEELMNFKPKGSRNFKIEDFKKFLNIPTNYRFSDINKRVLKPIQEDFKKHFIFFKIEKIKKGRNISNIIFNFKFKEIVYIPNFEDIKEAEVIEICEIEQYWKDNFTDVNYTLKHKKIIEKLKEKNSISYIKNYLQEQWSYVINNSEIKDKSAYFSSLILGEKAALKNYLSKEYEEKKKEDKKFVNTLFEIKEEKEKITRQDIELEQTSLFITEITKEEYKKIYQEYLKNNNLEDNEINKRIFNLSNKNRYKIIEKNNNDDLDDNDFNGFQLTEKQEKVLEKHNDKYEKNINYKKKIDKLTPQKIAEAFEPLSIKNFLFKETKTKEQRDYFIDIARKKYKVDCIKNNLLEEISLFDELLESDINLFCETFFRYLKESYASHFNNIESIAEVEKIKFLKDIKSVKENGRKTLKTIEEKKEYILQNMIDFQDEFFDKNGKKLNGFAFNLRLNKLAKNL